jgi:hypothetical protein
MLHKKLITGLIPVGLISGLAAVALAVVPAVASATAVFPPSTAFTGNLSAGPTGTLSVFVASNAYNEKGIGCATSTVTGTTPAGPTKAQDEAGTRVGNDNNINRTKIGTHSTGYGSVITDITPSFTSCAIYKWESNGKWVKVSPEIAATVKVTTKSEKKGWTFAAFRNATSAPYTAVGVPPSGATIEYTASGFTCVITVSPNEASSVFDEWENGKNSTEGKEAEWSKDRVDGQIDFETNGSPICEGESPAQFEATYRVRTTVFGATPVTIEP